MKFVHISALGVDNVKDSKYAFSKTNGEKLIREIMPTATIIKPSLVYSVDDNLTTKFMSLLSLLPFFHYITMVKQNLHQYMYLN